MSQNAHKRFRVFAGPNGSGKSSIIKQIPKIRISNRTLDLGTYVNADEIAARLRSDDGLNITTYCPTPQIEQLAQFASESGLLRDRSINELLNSFVLVGGYVHVHKGEWVDLIAQLLATYIVEILLLSGKKVSYETVFSHESKVRLMCKAKSLGYKVYLYFICTEDPAINVSRVQLRVKKGGHDVKADLIEKRYWKSLANLYPATDCAYQAHFFDNSGEEGQFYRVAYFKRGVGGEKIWGDLAEDNLPYWFIESCANHDQFLRAIITRN